MTLQLQSYPEPTKDEISRAKQDVLTTSTIVRIVRQKPKQKHTRMLHDMFLGKSKDTWCEQSDEIKSEYRKQLIERDGEKCKKCGKTPEETTLSVDHIFAISKGGPVNDINNIQFLCVKCHEEKTMRDIENGVSRRKLRKH